MYNSEMAILVLELWNQEVELLEKLQLLMDKSTPTDLGVSQP
jgi:hypothetical protein